VAKIVLPAQNISIQKPHGEIDPIWYEKLKGWESFINLLFAGFPTGAPLNPAPIHASLGADVALNASTYTDGPSISQGTSGTWWVSGNVTVSDSANSTTSCKLWDGTAVIDSGTVFVAAGANGNCHLSGYIVSPAANLKISCKSNTATTLMKFNLSGNSRDSTISAFRIA
jgi:hypothetical protein